MSDGDKIGGMIYKVSLDADDFIRGEKATNDAQDRIKAKAQESADAFADAEEKKAAATGKASERTLAFLKSIGYELKNSDDIEKERTENTLDSIKKVDMARRDSVENLRHDIRENDASQERFHTNERQRTITTAASFTTLATAAAGLWGLVTGAGAVNNLIQNDASRARFATLANVGVGRVGALENAFQLATGNSGGAEDMLGSLASLRSEIKLTGTSGRLPAFLRLGVTNPLAAPEEILTQLHKSTMGMDRDVATGLLSAAGLGADAQNLVLSPDFDKNIREGRARNTVNDGNAKGAQDAQRSENQLLIEQTNLLRKTFQDLNPRFQQFQHALEGIVKFFEGHPAIAEALGITAAATAAAAPIAVAASVARLGAGAAGAAVRGGASAVGTAGRIATGAGGIAGAAEALTAGLFLGPAYLYSKANVAADGSLPAEARGLLDQIASGEADSGGYATSFGGRAPLKSLADHPGVYYDIGNGKKTSAAGRYQFLQSTWRAEAKKLGLHDFSPASQDRAAWDLAQSDYHSRTGRDLLNDLRSGGHESDIATNLQATWTSLRPGYAFKAGINNRTLMERTFGGGSSGGGGGGKVTVNGGVHVHTNAKDAKGIAQDVKAHLESSTLVFNSARGLA